MPSIFESILMEQPRSAKNLVARYGPAIRKNKLCTEFLKQARRYRRFGQMDKDRAVALIAILMMYDPTSNHKYSDWIVRAFMAKPLDYFREGYILDRTHTQLRRFDQGLGKKFNLPTDIYQFKTINEFYDAMINVPDTPRADKRIGEFYIHVAKPRGFSRPGSNDAKYSRDVTLFKGEEKIGSFIMDFSYMDEGVVTMHSDMDRQHTGKGYANVVYGWIAGIMKSKYNLDLMPSDRLTDYSYRFWLKRMPRFMTNYVVDDKGSRYLPDGRKMYVLEDPKNAYRLRGAQGDLFD